MFTNLKSKITNFLSNFKEYTKTQKLLFFFILFFVFLASFSTMALSGRYPLNYFNNAIYLLLLLLIIIFLIFYGVFRFDIYFLLLFLFNFFVLFSSLLSGFKNFNFSALLVSTTSFFIYQLLINVDKPKQNVLFFSLFVGGLFFSAYFFVYYRNTILSFDFSNRIGGYFNNINEMAKYFVFLGLISFYLVLYKKRFEHIILFVIFLLFLVWTGSRSNLLSLIILILFLLYFKFQGMKKRYYLYVLLFLALISILVMQMDFMESFKTRLYNSFLTLFRGGSDNILDYSTESRKRALYEAFELFLQRPLFGYGYFGTNLYSFRQMSTHNNFVALLGGFGLPAFLAFETFLLVPTYLFIQNRKKYKKNDFALLSVAIISYVFIFQLFLINYYTKLEYFFIPFAYIQIYEPNQFVEINFRESKTLT